MRDRNHKALDARGTSCGRVALVATENDNGRDKRVPPVRNDNGRDKRVPPVRNDNGRDKRVPPAAATTIVGFPQRRHPSRNSVMTYHDNRSIILYVTVVAGKRNPILANKAVLDCILSAWKTATDWLVGWYVIMPDHIHFFCAPATYPPTDFHGWMKRWKAQVSRTFPIELRTGGSRLSRPDAAAGRVALVATENDADATSASLPCETAADATSASLPRLPPLFQRDCWDRQLRTGESYAQKWMYVRNNPVRKGLVANADDWPYQGRMNILEWHERI